MLQAVLVGFVILFMIESLTLYLAASTPKRRFWRRQAWVGFGLIVPGVLGGLLILFLPRGITGLADFVNEESLVLLFVLWIVLVLIISIAVLRRMRCRVDRGVMEKAREIRMTDRG